MVCECMIPYLLLVAGEKWEVPWAVITVVGGKSGPCLQLDNTDHILMNLSL